MGKRIAILLLLAPGPALAQGAVSALVSTQSQTDLANRADCANIATTSFWSWTSSSTATVNTGDAYRLAAYNTGCSTTVPNLGASNTVYNTDITATGTTQSFNGVLVTNMATAGGVTSCAGANDIQINICVYLIPGATSIGNGVTAALVSQGTFTYQLAIPPAPVISNVSPNNGSLTVSVTAGTTDANHTATTGVTYTVTCTPASGTGTSGSGTGNAGNITCGGLTNNVSYTVTAIGDSAAGNVGPVSDTYPAGQNTTPLPFESFWQIYKDAGGVETGGCGAGGAGALAPVAALAVLLLRRRRS